MAGAGAVAAVQPGPVAVAGAFAAATAAGAAAARTAYRRAAGAARMWREAGAVAGRAREETAVALGHLGAMLSAGTSALTATGPAGTVSGRAGVLLAPAAGGPPTVAGLQRELFAFQEAVLGALQALGEAGSAERALARHAAHRTLALCQQALGSVDALEGVVEDPDLLEIAFTVDHHVTRVVRGTESLIVLLGSRRRRPGEDTPAQEVLRLAISEVKEYRRVRAGPFVPATAIAGHVVPELTHLLAELIENATAFSPPERVVELSGRLDAGRPGLLLVIPDSGPGMSAEQLTAMNLLLAHEPGHDGRDLVSGGQIGLTVAARLARRHGITVRLTPNETAGVVAEVWLPQAALRTAPVPDPSAAGDPTAAAAAGNAPVPVPTAPHRFLPPEVPLPAPVGVTGTSSDTPTPDGVRMPGRMAAGLRHPRPPVPPSAPAPAPARAAWDGAAGFLTAVRDTTTPPPPPAPVEGENRP
ncbi:sensor histidine kinase [Streptomyces yaizuensis]|nr:ATP-binding protein [Streptomyces sp. YSPA8]